MTFQKIMLLRLRTRRRSPLKPHSPKPGFGEPGKTIGSVKKLSAKSPTPHVAKQPTPVGGVNVQGQQRYIDPTTGKDAYIDMKKPRVMGPRGIPVKA